MIFQDSTDPSHSSIELDFERLRVHAVYITSDEKWYVSKFCEFNIFELRDIIIIRLIAVATVLHAKSGAKPMKSRPEKRIVGTYMCL